MKLVRRKRFVGGCTGPRCDARPPGRTACVQGRVVEQRRKQLGVARPEDGRDRDLRRLGVGRHRRRRTPARRSRATREFNEEEKKTDGRFIQVHYKVTNKGKKEEMLLDRPKIVDDKGREFGPIDMESFYVPAKAKTIGLDTLQPSMPKEYWTVIEVPADAKSLKFQVHGFGLLGDKKNVDLGALISS